MAPRPTATVPGTTTSPADAGAEPSLGAAFLIRPAFVKQALPFLSSRLTPGQSVEVELWIDDKGDVSKVLLRGSQLPGHALGALTKRMETWQTSVKEALGKRFVLKFSAAELTAVRPPPPMPEMAPRPVPPRPEMTPRPEMAPRPPPKIK